MISLMTLALIWSRFWSGDPRHKQSLLGSKCPFCTSLVPSAGSAAPSSWFTHSWVQTNSHIHRQSHTYTHGREMCSVSNVESWWEKLWQRLGAHITTSLLVFIFTPQEREHRNTPSHALTPVSHLERSLVVGQQVKLLDQHVTEASDKPRDWDVNTQA